MSFALTERQLMDGTKDVTRRLGWADINPGDRFLAIRKGMGLKKGERQIVLKELVCVSVRREPLNKITQEDVRREGFPTWVIAGFMAMFCATHKGCKPGSIVTRIEFKENRP